MLPLVASFSTTLSVHPLALINTNEIVVRQLWSFSNFRVDMVISAYAKKSERVPIIVSRTVCTRTLQTVVLRFSKASPLAPLPHWLVSTWPLWLGCPHISQCPHIGGSHNKFSQTTQLFLRLCTVSKYNPSLRSRTPFFGVWGLVVVPSSDRGPSIT